MPAYYISRSQSISGSFGLSEACDDEEWFIDTYEVPPYEYPTYIASDSIEINGDFTVNVKICSTSMNGATKTIDVKADLVDG